MNEIQNKPILRLPLIGKIEIECLKQLGNIIEIPHMDDSKTRDLILNLQRALGDYLCDSEEDNTIITIIKLLFPKKDEIDVEKIIEITIEKLIENDEKIIENESFPLFARLFIRPGQIKDSGIEAKEKRKFSSAWTSLMLELGEFYLDERFNDLEKDIKDNLMKNLCVKAGAKEAVHNVLYALFDSYEKMIEEIWNRILGDDIFLIFIDDDELFADRWGLSENDTSKDDITYLRGDDGNMVLLNPLKINKSYDPKKTKNKIIDTVQSYLKEHPGSLPVLVVDLLIKDENGINRIQGDNLIKDLRHELNGTSFIIGFTGGRSPFVINSAVKAGADIVIMKERGETIKIFNSHGSGNPGGLFDLLWALSKNITRWRFLEKYKEYAKIKVKEDKHFYRPVLEQLFFSIENESPFWRKYLTEWQKDIENLRLDSILKSNSHD